MQSSKDKLNSLLESLTDTQKKIVEKRMHVPSDAAAYRGITSKASFYNYRRSVLGFKEAMTLAAKASEATATDVALLKVDNADVKVIARQQLEVLSVKLPEVFDRLFDIAIKGRKENDQLKAIRQICELFGLDSKVLKPQMLSVLQQSILNWVHPVAWSQGALDNLINLDADFSEEIIEGEFKEINANAKAN